MSLFDNEIELKDAIRDWLVYALLFVVLLGCIVGFDALKNRLLKMVRERVKERQNSTTVPDSNEHKV
ncbi:hypothetical protein ECANGB1_1142 [Enterospora canceri]|uniref:Uncharacterized protein n=1 Tax=Enterospora canceri TaxID=1081671 RepID=A0A1Y1S6M5_9MICR|nr:hypothetical protein ECANGB1_1142 [Enterospora canceri]